MEKPLSKKIFDPPPHPFSPPIFRYHSHHSIFLPPPIPSTRWPKSGDTDQVSDARERKRLNVSFHRTWNTRNGCLWRANATTDLSKKFCPAGKQSRGKDFPIDKRSLNHPSVIALFLHHSSADRRSAEEESPRGNDSSSSPLPRVLTRDNRSYRSHERATLETRISRLAIIFVGHGDACNSLPYETKCKWNFFLRSSRTGRKKLLLLFIRIWNFFSILEEKRIFRFVRMFEILIETII